MKRLTLWFMVAAMALMSASSLAFAQTPPLRPVVTYNVKMPSTGIATEFELVHLIQDFAPGASSPVHTHGGQGLALVLEGEITQRMEGQPDKVYKPGETFLETPGVYFAVANAGSVPARLSVGFLLPKGATLTTAQQTATVTAVPQPTLAPTVEPPPPAPVIEETPVPVVQPVGMPSTGSDGVGILLPLAAIALFCLALGSYSRSRRVRQR